MSDPIFLRNLISNTVYAEQINSAQIQGQAAARDRATRVRQEALKDEQAMINSLEEAATVDIKDQERRRHGATPQEAEQEEAYQEHPEDAGEDAGGEPVAQNSGTSRHIDLTV